VSLGHEEEMEPQITQISQIKTFFNL